MEHKYWEERLMGFIDKELDPADHTAVKQHIAECDECQAQLDYFSTMKRRLRQHRDSIEMPAAVDQRLRAGLAARHRRGVRLKVASGVGFFLAAAAALVLFFNPGQTFTEKPIHLVGTVVCYDCKVAERADIKKMTLCSDGKHWMGLECPDGSLWRIARDKAGVSLEAGGLFGQEVEIQGDIVTGTALLRVKDLKPTNVRQAAAF